jgi:hypothetical protein
MTRIDVAPADAAEIARLCYLLDPGRVLTRAEAVAWILREWRQAKRVNLAKPPKTP